LSFLEVVGADRAARMVRDVAKRAGMPAPGMVEMVPELEAAELELFEGYGGKYVLTGATKASLTQSDANGAIREAHGIDFIFGTSIWYAKFQGTTVGPSGVDHHGGPSAILAVPPGATELSSKIGCRYVINGFTGGLMEVEE
jgi:hypothetical protein